MPDGDTAGLRERHQRLAGDDVQRIPIGQSEPGWIGILPGPNDVIDSIPAGDDASTSVICPGVNTNIDSAIAGDDVSGTQDARWPDLCGASFGCVLPGADDILQTTLSGDDVFANYLSTGADGILSTETDGDDIPETTWRRTASRSAARVAAFS